MTQKPNTPQDPELQPRPEFEADLGALFRPQVDVPVEIDRDIRTRARLRLGASRRPGRWLAALAAAAALFMVVTLWHPSVDELPKIAGPGSSLQGDLDRSGRVDILDAFLLARELEVEEEPASPTWDFNEDGAVDSGDVENLALVAVRLP
jgi:hypothetical protein